MGAVTGARAGRRLGKQLQDDRMLRRAADLAGVGLDLWFAGSKPPPMARLLRILIVRRQLQLALRGVEARRFRRRRRRAVVAAAALAALVVRDSMRGRATRAADV
jgi:hypothetical protein